MYDVIIIGGGAIGTSIGRRLSRYELKLGLVEKNTEVCQETTKANSAIVHGGYDAEPGSLKARLNVRGNEMYGDLAKELNFEFIESGSLVLGFNDDDIKVLEGLYERGMENGVRGLDLISGDRARELEPFISEKVIKALYCSSGGIVNPFGYTYAMVENAIENGMDLFTEREVVGLEKKDDHILVKTEEEDFKARYVINAGGLYSDKIANMGGDDDFYIIPTKGVYRLLAKDRYQELSRVVFQTPSELGKGVLVTPTYDYNTMIGPTSEKIGGESYVKGEEYSLKILDSLGKKSIPSLNLNKTIRVFTGIRAKPNTGDFMIYPSENMKGLVHAGGIESPGLASAPAIAEYVEEILKDIGLGLKPKNNYKPNRKAIVRTVKLSKEERKKLADEDPTYGRIICRCEQVTEHEVLEAINRPGGAVTVDGVKRRIRPGMGFCQGNYCGPRVRKILAQELKIAESEIKTERKGNEIVEEFLED